MERQLREKPADRSRKEEAAQQLVYDAMGAGSLEEERQMLALALELDPENIDALLMSLHRKNLRPDAEVEELRRLVARAEKRLGDKFATYEGSFWGFTETRPYMRVRQSLADALFQGQRFDEAVVEWEAMLKLNPSDNQGIRYRLLAVYLLLSRPDDAEILFQRYDECEWSAAFAWSRVLQRWLLKDEKGASKALAAARKQNGFVEAYLRGHRAPPRKTPAGYAPGSREEAAVFAEDLLPAWRAHPQAQSWLAQQPKPDRH